MTVPAAAELGVSLSWRRNFAARAAVGVARLLIQLPPRRLRQALELASRGARPATAAQALAARQATVTVSARCAGQGCLQRSVATALLCRGHGRWPDWCTGVRTQPFRAHAWVEADGVAIGEFDDMTAFHPTMSVRKHR
ncbi:lasso peptide biosynthesis B2 protein [Amycolatopsis magusensis]|uniref:Microcin J25-processing protein McjB C-terminal domain-containing protein n=1 Tax=Amycolatopsis magusensis TaxID=882444 RepID=A0ABS4PQS0_9PSEU|nr:lasso peptide biosynthesis B2 protein [Amycolatopsis magusensis]MBP2181759.1 hypothetical protein [Amycolatopsis magusensis]